VPAGQKRRIFMYFNVLHYFRNYLALTLLMTAILADDAHNTIAPYNLAVTTNTLDRSTYFHVISPRVACR